MEATELAAYIVVPINTWCEEPMTELRTNDEEQAERLLRVLHLREEVRCETEGERDLRRLVEVRLQDVPRCISVSRGVLTDTDEYDALVEDQEAL